jgi:glycoprotein endo-alpha-1,2-mannosidase
MIHNKQINPCQYPLLISLVALLSVVLSGCKTDSVDAGKNTSEITGSPKAQVGAYYYPWYKKDSGPEKHDWKNAMRLLLKNEQKPMLGKYDSSDPKVVGEHINQSVRGGIDFWAVSWWGPGSPTDKAFRDVILPHPDACNIKYAVLYESTGRLGTFDKPNYDNWLPDLEYMKATYFTDPAYLHIEGRPVVFVYLTREYFRNRGHEALQQMREQFPEIYLVGDDVFYGDGNDVYEAEWAKPFDAVTSYDIYGQSVGPYGGTEKAVKILAENYAKAKKIANTAGTAFMPAIAPGYNDTAVREGHPGRARYFSDLDDSKEGDIFRAMIRQAALPHLDPGAGNIMMVTSFNEWYEDSQIEPTAGTAKSSRTDQSDSGTFYTGGQWYPDYGFLYLDILREETD